jgi:hypothetical protein
MSLVSMFRRRTSRLRLSDLPGYNLHYSPSTLASLSLSGPSTINSITSITGTPVSSVATLTTRPTHVASDSNLNGRGSILFDAVDDILINNSFAIAQPCTIFVVAYGATPTSRFIFDGYNLAFPFTQERMAIVGNGSEVAFYAGSGLIVTSGAPSMTTPHIYELIMNGASSQLYIDGVLRGSGNPGAHGFTGGFNLGGRNDASAPSLWNGNVGDLILCTGAMSAPWRAIGRSILGAENGIATV